MVTIHHVEPWHGVMRHWGPELPEALRYTHPYKPAGYLQQIPSLQTPARPGNTWFASCSKASGPGILGNNSG